MTQLFKSHTQEEMQRVLAAYVPDGNALVAKNFADKNIYKVLFWMSGEAVRFESLLNLIYNEYDIATTTLLIEEWENAVGIPDDCFSRNVSLAQRRIQVLVKFALKADTRQSFIDIAALFGIECTIENATIVTYPFSTDLYPWPYTSHLWASCTLYVNLPADLDKNIYPFSITHYPWPYGSNNQNIITCFFNKIKQATCQLIFRYILV